MTTEKHNNVVFTIGITVCLIILLFGILHCNYTNNNTIRVSYEEFDIKPELHYINYDVYTDRMFFVITYKNPYNNKKYLSTIKMVKPSLKEYKAFLKGKFYINLKVLYDMRTGKWYEFPIWKWTFFKKTDKKINVLNKDIDRNKKKKLKKEKKPKGIII